MDKFEGLKVGSKVRCINSAGWEDWFEQGEVYTVVMYSEGTFDLGRSVRMGGEGGYLHPCAIDMFSDDFELVEA